MTEQQKLLSEICRLNILKIILSDCRSKEQEIKKVHIKPVKIREQLCYQVESFSQKQAFHQNISVGELCEKLDSLLSEQFKQAQLLTPEYIYGIKISSKGKLLHNRVKNTEYHGEAQVTLNNRKKNHIIDIENMPPVFRELGICGADGKIINSKYDKFRQICRFTEIINHVVSKDNRECFNIVDFGCGKSYLTFVVHHYFTKILGKKVNIVGLDLKQDVIDSCNSLCNKYGIKDVSFLCMDVKDYVPQSKVDMVIALHACDIATDFALYNAYLWQADYIFSAPCCQHEMNSIAKSQNYSLLFDYGLLKERFCALSTDAVRCKLLELCGYSVDVIEFVDSENSPKNLLIRACRKTKNIYKDIKRIKNSLDEFNNEFCQPLAMQKMVMQDLYNTRIGDKEFSIIIGKASMLVRDNVALRSEVFGREMVYEPWSGRDIQDEEALFLNIYCEDKISAACRMLWTDKANGKVLFGRIAVDKNYRGFGLGRVMLEHLCSKAALLGAKTVFVDAKTHALGFYKTLGFNECNGVEPDKVTDTVRVYKSI